MRRLEFMQDYAGQPGAVSGPEQQEATSTFLDITSDIFTEHRDGVHRATIPGTRVELERLQLAPTDSLNTIASARVSRTKDDNDNSPYGRVDLLLPQGGGTSGIISYVAQANDVVRRHDTPDAHAFSRPSNLTAPGALTRFIQDQAIARAQERRTNTNGCPVGPDEIQALGRLISTLAVRKK